MKKETFNYIKKELISTNQLGNMQDNFLAPINHHFDERTKWHV
jgi:hypothetical protein